MVEYKKWFILGALVGIILNLITSLNIISQFIPVSPISLQSLIIVAIGVGLSAMLGRFIYNFIPFGKGLYLKLFLIFFYSSLALLLLINVILKNIDIDIQIIQQLSTLGIMTSLIFSTLKSGIAYLLNKFNLLRTPD